MTGDGVCWDLPGRERTRTRRSRQCGSCWPRSGPTAAGPTSPQLASTAYATGQALFALHTAGLPSSDAAYERGVQFLLKTQQEDGSWYVRTRALGFQPYFDAGFPYGFDQWISAAGTSWATMALATASPKPAPSANSSRTRASQVREKQTGSNSNTAMSARDLGR